MSWAIGYDEKWKRDVGYGVPGYCDHPVCGDEIDRGLAHVCGGDAFGGEYGCGLFFCARHLRPAGDKRESAPLCDRCYHGRWGPYKPTPEREEWIRHKLTDESWAKWRSENPEGVHQLNVQLAAVAAAQNLVALFSQWATEDE